MGSSEVANNVANYDNPPRDEKHKTGHSQFGSQEFTAQDLFQGLGVPGTLFVDR